MATTNLGELTRRPRNGAARGASHRLPLRSLLALSMLIIGAGCFIAYALWPRWPAPPVEPNAPSLPITVAGVGFNVPPAAMRVQVQRRPGAHERVDLAFLWPSLAPPEPIESRRSPGSGTQPAPAHPLDRVFIMIAAAGDTLAPSERVKTIYPRYAANAPDPGPDGLAILAFRTGTPYQNEDLIYDSSQPDDFLVRCTRDGAGPTPGICLYMRRIERADLVARFPRDWLGDWRTVKNNLERLIAQLRAHPYQHLGD
jgi:hypothetical protein